MGTGLTNRSITNDPDLTAREICAMSEPRDDGIDLMGEDGLSGEEEEVDDQDDEDDPIDSTPPAPRDEQHATIVAFVARRKINTVDTKPGGFAWFSA